MKLKFKIQSHQTNAVEAVVDCFQGQPKDSLSLYHMDHGQHKNLYREDGFRNREVLLDDAVLLKNVQEVQKRQNLPISNTLWDFTAPSKKGLRKPVNKSYEPGAKINLDIEMETGTGKTYCYIKTMFEMHERFGWSKFIVMVPSIAIREGVKKSFESTAEHFAEIFGRRARYFTYNSKHLHQLESFSSDAGINVMIINIQAFNARGADNRRIYDELDEFQSRRPIDVLSANRPILILDEPQKMEGRATLDALPKFNPLMILRYSATHRTQHCQVHRLDALDAYNEHLVKKISVRGIQMHGTSGTSAYLFLEGIEISTKAPIARIEMEVKLGSGEIRRRVKRLAFRDDLYAASNGLDQYRGYMISQIDAKEDVVEFTNGKKLFAGEAIGDVSENDIRRIQIRETIRVHLEKEQQLFKQGIKVLSLFFIDEVKRYRDYEQNDTKGEYARTFEQEYEALRSEYLSNPVIGNEDWQNYLVRIDSAKTHKGYFSIDRKGQMTNPKVKRRGIEKGFSDDATAYNLILKEKERLLSFDEPTRFIFSHSALREGWDNPNVFVMCMLKHSDSSISRRQEVGRGLRLSVNQRGERNDHPALVHEINILSVVANESYEDFVRGLQTEITDTISARPRKADISYFTGKSIPTDQGLISITTQMARQIYHFLVRNEFVDDTDAITNTYHQAKAADQIPNMGRLEPYRYQIIELIDSVFDDSKLPKIEDGRKRKNNPLNDNFKKKEFQELWSQINRKAIYQVHFDSQELIDKCTRALNSKLRVESMRFTIKEGIQRDEITYGKITDHDSFTVTKSKRESGSNSHSQVRYDLLGKFAEDSEITRKTAAIILGNLDPQIFEQYVKNPEQFISKSSQIIAEEKAPVVIERLIYDQIDERYDVSIFTANQTGQDFSRATQKLKRHIYDYAITDSNVEKEFAHDLDVSSEVVVYAKLPRGFLIPTPVGNYNPDWAISLKVDGQRHIYFVAETKGTMFSMKLREIENCKIECAKKFFDEINKKIKKGGVVYDKVNNYDKLMGIISSHNKK